jgi:glycosyltransferase involved in cell wall biosynthesis
MAAERPRRVLMTADTIGGVWHYAIELAAALGKRGVHTVLATMGAPLAPAQHEQIAALRSVTLHESGYRLEWMEEPWTDVLRAGEWLLRLERELAPDIVHLNQFAFGALPFSSPKLLVAHSCVLSWWRAVHGTTAPPAWNRYRECVRSGLDGADLVVAPTRAMLRSLSENYGYQASGCVIPNGRSAPRYAPGRKEPVVLAAGRLWDEGKNLGALEIVAPHLPWPVLVAGSTRHPDGGVRSTRCVLSLGELTPAALARHYARAAIYASPARYEPFGLSVLEAGRCGCALVLGDIPTLREVWGEDALYVPPDDHVALRDRIGGLIADTTLRARFARRARERALGYTSLRMARGYIRAYSELMSRAGVHPVRAPLEAMELRACAS